MKNRIFKGIRKNGQTVFITIDPVGVQWNPPFYSDVENWTEIKTIKN